LGGEEGAFCDREGKEGGAGGFPRKRRVKPRKEKKKEIYIFEEKKKRKVDQRVKEGGVVPRGGGGGRGGSVISFFLLKKKKGKKCLLHTMVHGEKIQGDLGEKKRRALLIFGGEKKKKRRSGRALHHAKVQKEKWKKDVRERQEGEGGRGAHFHWERIGFDRRKRDFTVEREKRKGLLSFLSGRGRKEKERVALMIHRKKYA